MRVFEKTRDPPIPFLLEKKIAHHSLTPITCVVCLCVCVCVFAFARRRETRDKEEDKEEEEEYGDATRARRAVQRALP